jgi:hypothetical protein
MSIFSIGITISGFGTLEEFYKQFAKGNRLISVDDVEFEGTAEQHNVGTMTDSIICNEENLKDKVREYITESDLDDEYFSVTKKGRKKVILTEDDI